MRFSVKAFYLPLVLLLAACHQKKAVIDGYVEGEYVYISPTTGGVLGKLDVDRGTEVKAGTPFFSLDLTKPVAAVQAAEAALVEATAHWDDLTKGKRPDEIAVILDQKAQAEAALQNADIQLKRTRRTAHIGTASKAQMDAAQTAYDEANARVSELEASLKVAHLPAREDALAEARAAVDAAEQNLVQAKQSLREAAPVAPAGGRVEDIYYRPGEYVAAGAPVISFLPPGNVKIRFFVSEKTAPLLRAGEEIGVSCDGCGAAIPAKISFIASRAEFTPPVIYSVESREKLVFMIEAKPEKSGARLHPGLPVNIILPPAAP
ncbi:MAG: HlyD family efflux transporter periplasmic adaptor subunit [Alphaproteobacteria bacterium]|nr:HlyD family efflux transporter periplasmic adaptor subunit [Alphaproteobacteria bacterium]